MNTVKKLCTALALTSSVTYGARKPPIDPNWKPAHSWTVTLRLGRKRMTVDFFGGAATGEPTASEVLSCLISDACAEGESFEEWCDDYGYDSDSRSALATYEACAKSGARLREFLGDHFDTFANAERD